MARKKQRYKELIKSLHLRGFKAFFYLGEFGDKLLNKNKRFGPTEVAILETHTFLIPTKSVGKVYLYGILTKSGIKGLLERRTLHKDSIKIENFVKTALKT